MLLRLRRCHRMVWILHLLNLLHTKFEKKLLLRTIYFHFFFSSWIHGYAPSPTFWFMEPSDAPCTRRSSCRQWCIRYANSNNVNCRCSGIDAFCSSKYHAWTGIIIVFNHSNAFDYRLYADMMMLILPWRRSVWQTDILVIFLYIFIHIWFLVCCVALVLLHFVQAVYYPHEVNFANCKN